MAVSPDLGQDRLKVLDGLRAMAILLMLVRHSLIALSASYTYSLPYIPFLIPFLLNTWCGVDLFFVLSGFLIARQLLADEGIVQFYKRRFFRIVPAYYTFLTLACLGVFPTFPSPPLSDPTHVWRWRYPYHLLFLQDIFPNDIDYIYWSLAVEFQFYILAPFLVAGLLLVNRRQRNLLFALAAVLSVSLKAWAALRWFPEGIDSDTYFRTVYSHFPFRLDGFIAGMFAAFLWRDEGTRRSLGRPLVATGLFWSGAGLLVSWAGLSTPVDFHVGLFSEVFQMSLLALAFGAMMLGLLGGSFGHKVFMSRPLRFIGLVSYSLYLTHGAVLRPSINTVLRVVPMNHPMLAWLLSLIPILFFGMCLSTVSYYVIEKPCIAWSRKSKAQSMTF